VRHPEAHFSIWSVIHSADAVGLTEGVGSSPLGTAALARAVADALDTDVAGIITGYGLSDVMAEALCG